MPRWFLVVIAALVGVAIYNDISEQSADEEPSWGDAVAIDRLADMEAAATILAKSEAEEAFRSASGGVARDLARTTALKVLLDGGCVEWEMSQWDPSRGMAERAAPKSRGEAEATCGAQADTIADRIAARAR